MTEFGSFPSNSHNPPEPKPEKIEPVVTSEVIRRKPPFFKRFGRTMVNGDAHTVWEYVLFGVIIPATKDTVADAVSQGIERMIFGEARSSSRKPSSGVRQVTYPGGYVGYNSISKPTPKEGPSSLSKQARTFHNFDEIIIASRAEAEDVLERMYDILNRYEAVSVRDFYGLLNIEPSYTDEKWGWTELRGSSVTRVRTGGYLVELPRPVPLP